MSLGDTEIHPMILLRWRYKFKKMFKNNPIAFKKIQKGKRFHADTGDLLIIAAENLFTVANLLNLGNFLFSRAKYKLVIQDYEQAHILDLYFFFHLLKSTARRYALKIRVFFEHTIINGITGIYLFLTLKLFRKGGKEKKILFLFPGAVGDIITISPIIRAIWKKYQDARIVFAGGCSNHSNLEFCPYINDVIYYDDFILREKKGKFSCFTVYKFVIKLKLMGKFDKIITNLLNWPTRGSAWPGWPGYLLYSLNATEKIAWSMGNNMVNKKDRFTKWVNPKSNHITERWLEVMKEVKIPVVDESTEVWYDPGSDLYIENYFKQKKISTKKLLVGIFPGAGSGDTKRWPETRFAKLADLLVETYDSRIFIAGGENDRFVCNEVSLFMNKSSEVFCEEPLSKTMALIKKLDIIITNDSGPMHIAAALKKITAAIFGPTNPETWAPKVDQIAVIRKDICLPCGKYSYCSLGRRLCIDTISVEDVYTAVAGLIERHLNINGNCPLMVIKNDNSQKI